MITALGFVENKGGCSKLKKFVPDPEIKKTLEYLSIPLVDEVTEPHDTENEESEFEEISPEDKIVWATPNTEIASSLVFHLYDHGTLSAHHDTFVFSVILDAATVNENFVATATYEPHIFLYDAFTAFPILPQQLLRGHMGPVTGVMCHDGRLMSCSEDRMIIEWDLERGVPKETTDSGMPLERFDFSGSSLIYGATTSVVINNESFFITADVERVKLRGNMAYVLDAAGGVTLYDTRNLSSVVLYKKLHDDGVMDIDFYGDSIATCSVDKTVRTWDGQFQETGRFSKSCPVLRILYGDQGELFCGDEHDSVSTIVFEKDTEDA